MNQFLKLFFISVILSTSLTVTVRAEIWSEREMLANIERELTRLEILVLEAQKQKDPSSRLYFDYQSLKSDLEKVRQGILVHLSKRMEPVVPSELNSLNAVYSEKKQ